MENKCLYVLIHLVYMTVFLYRAVPEGHCSEWLSHLQLVGELPTADLYQDPGQEGWLHHRGQCRVGGLSA